MPKKIRRDQETTRQIALRLVEAHRRYTDGTMPSEEDCISCFIVGMDISGDWTVKRMKRRNGDASEHALDLAEIIRRALAVPSEPPR